MSAEEQPPAVNGNAQDNDSNAMEVDTSLGTTVFPLARVKKIVKLDPDVPNVQQDAIFLIAKATELFLENYSWKLYEAASAEKRKTVQYRDMVKVVQNTDAYFFLEAMALVVSLAAAFVAGCICTLALPLTLLYFLWQSSVRTSNPLKADRPRRSSRLRKASLQTDEDAIKIGWVTVSRHPLARMPSTSNGTATTATTADIYAPAPLPSVNAAATPTTPSSSSSSTASSVFGIFQKAKPAKKTLGSLGKFKHQYCYTMLKNNSLFLYQDETVLECIGVILLSLHTVELYPDTLDDNECYSKDFPVMLRKGEATVREGEAHQHPDLDADYYLYFSSAIEKESWFFAMLQCSKISPRPSFPCSSYADDFGRHLSTIEQDPHAAELAWLNVLIGRVFYGMYKEQRLQERVIAKFTRKLERVQLPSILESIDISAVDVGNSAPILGNPKLLQYTAAGEVVAEVDMLYEGGFKVELTAHVVLGLGSAISNIAQKFSSSGIDKEYTLRVPIVLRVLLKRLAGRLKVLIRPPPSNRVWIGFLEQPQIELSVEPVVSRKEVRVSVLTQYLERHIREIVDQAVVLPHMDDFCFFPTADSPLGAGGIFRPPAESDRHSEDVGSDARSISSSTPSMIGSLWAPSSRTGSSHEPEPLSATGVTLPPILPQAGRSNLEQRRLANTRARSFVEEPQPVEPPIAQQGMRQRSVSLSAKTALPDSGGVADAASLLDSIAEHMPIPNNPTAPNAVDMPTRSMRPSVSAPSIASAPQSPTQGLSTSSVNTASTPPSRSSLASSLSNLFSRSLRHRPQSAQTSPTSSPQLPIRAQTMRVASTSSNASSVASTLAHNPLPSTTNTPPLTISTTSARDHRRRSSILEDFDPPPPSSARSRRSVISFQRIADVPAEDQPEPVLVLPVEPAATRAGGYASSSVASEPQSPTSNSATAATPVEVYDTKAEQLGSTVADVAML
ncbi:hypothetical protein RI367_002759 [Sorochytrium milnesiophthora]